jgi:hypothetical protein
MRIIHVKCEDHVVGFRCLPPEATLIKDEFLFETAVLCCAVETTSG